MIIIQFYYKMIHEFISIPEEMSPCIKINEKRHMMYHERYRSSCIHDVS